MNPLFQEGVGSLVRWALTIVAGYLVQQGIWTDAQAASLVTGIALAVTVLLWSVWQKYVSRRVLLVALSEANTTEAQVRLRVKTGVVPAVSTPRMTVPKATADATRQ